MNEISTRFTRVNQEINEACEQYGRAQNSVKLIAVSKRHTVAAIESMAALGQSDFAENYLQEAQEKIAALKHLNLTWHFIGHIQSRKCKQIAEQFDWVHTVCSVKVANKLSANRQGKPLNILIQLNLQNEDSKSGISAKELFPLAQHIMQLPSLRLHGLMMIPENQNDFNKQLEVFKLCANLLEQLRQQTGLQENHQNSLHPLNQLSMGMSNDMHAAICAGSTMLRIGTALFGAREN